MRRISTLLAASALAMAGISLAAPAFAESELTGDLIVDARLRYEFVEQDGLEDANALTARLRLGWEQALPLDFKILAEGEAVGQLNDDFADTVRTAPGQAVVLDPEALEVNRLQVEWGGIDGLTATVGRQRVILNNARFVGNVGFRQNEQTFDAGRLSYRLNERATFHYLYIDRVRRILGDDSPQGEWRSDSHVAQVDLAGGFGGLSAYAYLLDFENAATQSSQTYGARWSKAFKLRPYGLALTAEAARQSEYGNQPAAFDLGYYHLEAGVTRSGWRVAAAGELLEGDGRKGFSTPLATLHAFQGWADVFLATPPEGVRDLNLTIGYTLDAPPLGRKLALIARGHDFATDQGGDDLGAELDLLARLTVDDHWAVEAKAAVFDGEDPRFADRNKIWLALEATF